MIIVCSGLASLKCRQVGDENVSCENIWGKWISGKRHSKDAGVSLVCVSKTPGKPEQQKRCEGRGQKIKVEE